MVMDKPRQISNEEYQAMTIEERRQVWIEHEAWLREQEPIFMSQSYHPGVIPGNYHKPGLVADIPPSRGVFMMLGIFLGWCGAHNFYAGYYKKALIQAALGGLLVWTFIVPFIIGIWGGVEGVSITVDAKGRIMR
jgi:TM2 domain-containing membrane protein YozV